LKCIEIEEGFDDHLDEILDIVALPKFGADEYTIVFAGFGSGATMANQMHFVYSTEI